MRRFASPGLVAAFTVLVMVGSLACQRAMPPLPTTMRADKAAAPPPEAQDRGFVGEEAADEAAPASPAGAMIAARKLIRTGEIALVVEDWDAAVAEVERIAAGAGGYVASSDVHRGAGDRRAGSLTVRVPAERFAATLAALRALGRVERESSGTQDITREYADLETRLAVKREAQGRLREILRTATGKLGEVLEVERELARVTEEIERLEGERRYYDQLVALSTLTVSLAEPEALVRPGVLAPLAEALRSSLRVLATSVAYVVYLVVFALPWLVLAALVWWLLRRRRRSRSA